MKTWAADGATHDGDGSAAASARRGEARRGSGGGCRGSGARRCDKRERERGVGEIANVRETRKGDRDP